LEEVGEGLGAFGRFRAWPKSLGGLENLVAKSEKRWTFFLGQGSIGQRGGGLFFAAGFFWLDLGPKASTGPFWGGVNTIAKGTFR
jgi:hypothetical protein